MTKSRLHYDLKIQFGLTHDCIRACIYSDHIIRENPEADAWVSLVDILYTEAVLTWSQLFGVYSEQTHWKHFVSKLSRIPPSLNPFSSDLICKYLKIERTEWDDFHTQMISVRNKRLAHIDQFYNVESFPGVDWMFQSCYFYRQWLLELLNRTTQPNNDPEKGKRLRTHTLLNSLLITMLTASVFKMEQASEQTLSQAGTVAITD